MAGTACNDLGGQQPGAGYTCPFCFIACQIADKTKLCLKHWRSLEQPIHLLICIVDAAHLAQALSSSDQYQNPQHTLQ